MKKMKKTKSRTKKTARPTSKGPKISSRVRAAKMPRTRNAGPRAAGTDPKRVRAILQKLDEDYRDVTCALVHESPFQLLISTILSAQCTDERVNKVTQTLF